MKILQSKSYYADAALQPSSTLFWRRVCAPDESIANDSSNDRNRINSVDGMLPPMSHRSGLQQLRRTDCICFRQN